MKIEVKRYNNPFESVPIHSLLEDFGDSNTDISTWKPDISSIRAFLGNPTNRKTLLYDFPDGKDTGEFVQTFIRSKGLDITEIETAEKRITQVIEDKKQSDKEKIDQDNQRKQDLKDLSDSIKSAGDSSESPHSPQSSQSSNT